MVDNIMELHLKLSKKIRQQGENAQQVNKKRLKGPTFKEGNKVYLLIKNLKSKQKCRKLDHIQIGPFKVEQQTSNVNYRLKLPEKAQIHWNFHVSLLEPAPADAQVKIGWNMEKEEEYDMEKILDKRKVREKTQYLVKWLRYEDKKNSWEPAKNLSPETAGKIEEYWQRCQKKSGWKGKSQNHSKDQ